MRTGISRLDQPRGEDLPPGSRRRRLTIAGTVVAVLAGSGLAADQGGGRAAAAPRPETSPAAATSLVPPGLTWTMASPTAPATGGTPLSLLARRSAKDRVLTLRPEAFNALTLRAYVSAARSVAGQDPGCGLTWQMLAGIGRIESDNGRDVAAGGGMTADGTIAPPILGPALDGKDGFAAIRDGRGWAHAAGPFQFIPSTWHSWGADGNGDGRTDVENIFDASLGAAHYLCAGGRQLSRPRQLADAVFSYNHSRQYVQLVLQLVAGYAHESAATLLAEAQLQRLPAGTPVARTPVAVAAVATPASPSWHAPTLTGRVAAGGTISLRPLATAPAAVRKAAVRIAAGPSRGSAVVLGSTIVVHAPAGLDGTETFRYSVAGHGTAAASVRVEPTAADVGSAPTTPAPTTPTTSSPWPPPAGPSGSFNITVTPSASSLDLSGTDTGRDTRPVAMTLTSSWTFALQPAAGGGTATLVLPVPPTGPSPSPSPSPSPGPSASPSASPTPDGDPGWGVSRTWSAGGLDYVLIVATTTCDAGQSCTAAGGPTAVAVDGGGFARATHDLIVADATSSSADATATGALPLSGTQLELQAAT